ncbi:MAG: glycoside hydrolase family 3 protein [Desulfovibrio sp.]|nr:glycoside hydrolase family 3 protein [Desulfovibrio sp.]
MFSAARVACLAVTLCFVVLGGVTAASAASGPAAGTGATGQNSARNTPSLDMMIGSMLMLGFRGAELPPGDAFLAQVRTGHVGHVILFDRDVTTGGERNIASPRQLRQLTATLRAAAPGPLLIAVDQEGGRVRRLKTQKGFADLPSAQSMGAGQPEKTRAMARQLGKELAALGISVDLAPVADVNSNPANPAIGALERSFSPNPALVAAHALAFGQGLAQQGVIPALKHFPGQGGAQKDSHLGLTDITRSWNAKADLAPYAQAFAQGWPGMVMLGHLFHTGLDANYPATLSRAIVADLLRGRMGWQGVIISDDMQMKAITDHYGLEQAVLLAVNAGVDILLFGNNLYWDENLPRKAFATLKGLVESGRISQQRIMESWLRISNLYTNRATAVRAAADGSAALYPWAR